MFYLGEMKMFDKRTEHNSAIKPITDHADIHVIV